MPTPNYTPITEGPLAQARHAKAKALAKANKSWGENYGVAITSRNLADAKAKADELRNRYQLTNQNTPSAVQASRASDAAYKKQQSAYDAYTLAEDQRNFARRVSGKTPAMIKSEAEIQKKYGKKK
jgi:hypothetical protein